jgi:hypothetical protein
VSFKFDESTGKDWLSVMPEVVSGTFPFTFSTLVELGAVLESVEVDVLLLLLQARTRFTMMDKKNSFFM